MESLFVLGLFLLAVTATAIERLNDSKEDLYKSLVIPDGNAAGRKICELGLNEAKLLRSMIHQLWWYNEDLVHALDRRIQELN